MAVTASEMMLEEIREVHHMNLEDMKQQEILFISP